jgi:hypothetical protein
MLFIPLWSIDPQPFSVFRLNRSKYILIIPCANECAVRGGGDDRGGADEGSVRKGWMAEDLSLKKRSFAFGRSVWIRIFSDASVFDLNSCHFDPLLPSS